MTQFKYLRQVIVIFEKIIAEFRGEVVGCTVEEVNIFELMLPQPYRLPAAYKEFLFYGGKQMVGYSQLENMSYEEFVFWCENKQEICDFIFETEDSNAQLPPEMFILNVHLADSFAYLKLTEGEDPPVYTWKKSDGGGLETVKKYSSSFSKFLKSEIRVHLIFWRGSVISQKIEVKQPPRGQQLWIPTSNEFKEGVSSKELSKYFGITPQRVQKITTLVGLDRDSYLEELSGWKCRKISENNSEVRFFPPEGWQS